MNRIALLLCIVALVVVSGCGGVYMNAEYSGLLDKTASLSAETASRAQAGSLAPAEMVQALVLQSQTWQKFVDARDGRDGK